MIDYRNPTSIRPIHFTGASQELWEGNPARRAVILFIPSGITLWLSYANPAVVAQGIPLSNQTYPYIFDCDRFGDLPAHQAFCISSGVADGGMMEVFSEIPVSNDGRLDLRSVGFPGSDYRSS